MAGKKKTNPKRANVGYEAEFRRMADAPRGNMDADCKHVVLGLVLVKSISDAFAEPQAKLRGEKKQATDPEAPPLKSRWLFAGRV